MVNVCVVGGIGYKKGGMKEEGSERGRKWGEWIKEMKFDVIRGGGMRWKKRK